MRITGLQTTTLLDYPGHVAATIFLGGCNFRCPFCHNMDIVLKESYTAGQDSIIQDENASDSADKTYSEEEIISFLNKRGGILDGVCITGGEPTLYRDLPDFIRKIKQTGMLVKLDTNGTNPDMLKYLFDNHLVDYVAMDLKSSIERYEAVAGLDKVFRDETAVKAVTDKIFKSIDIIKSWAPDYEFRTTVMAEYHDKEEMKKIGELIKGCRKYFMQAFNDSDFVPDHSLSAPDKDTLNEFKDIVKDYADFVEIRGVD